MSKRVFRSFALAAILASPATAATPAERVSEAHFAAAFTAHSALPQPSAPAAGAVDLDTFDPPIEEAPVARAIGSGTASYYGAKFQGRRTASGEKFDMHAMTAAHRTLPFGTLVEVTNPRNGKTVTVRINDRGPFHGNRILDVSRAAATELGLIQRGSGTVELALLD
ncbi:MAG: septal ring lytic transglycosylase RlpA family protein [Pseudomonadota bacterium]|jgi:rare lipoprotein A|nr:septal ring lytic transglycosylase RlpA family protein [Pseudomonadota bacterium]